MKILLIDVNCKNSSTGNIVYNLYKECQNTDIEAAVCYGRGSKIKERNILKFGYNIETWFHALLARITGLNGFFSFFSTRRLISFVKKYNPDVICIHELHAYFINVFQFLKYLSKTKIKVLWTFHCEYMYTGKCGNALSCNNWINGCGNCPQIKKYPKSLFFDWTKKMHNLKKKYMNKINLKGIIAPSNWIKQRIELSYLKNNNIYLINNGIDTDIFKYKKSTILPNYSNKKIILSVAPKIIENESKGGLVILELAKKFINDDVLFILIGGERDENYENVILLKAIYDKNLLSEYYSKADLFLICSNCENFPTTCLEAQCCGTIVSGFDVGGVVETSVFKENKFVKYKDIESLETTIRQLIAYNYDKEILSNIAISKYSNNVMTKKYIELIKSI